MTSVQLHRQKPGIASARIYFPTTSPLSDSHSQQFCNYASEQWPPCNTVKIVLPSTEVALVIALPHSTFLDSTEIKICGFCWIVLSLSVFPTIMQNEHLLKQYPSQKSPVGWANSCGGTFSLREHRVCQLSKATVKMFVFQSSYFLMHQASETMLSIFLDPRSL